MSKIKTVLAALLLFIFLFTACQQAPAADLGVPDVDSDLLVPEELNYSTAVVEGGDYLQLEQGGLITIYPVRTDLYLEVSDAVIEEVLVTSGSVVSKGDVLATYTLESSRVALEELQLSLQRKQESYSRDASAQWDAVKEAREKVNQASSSNEKKIARLQADKVEIFYERTVYQYEYDIENLRAQIAALEERLNENTIVAPADGTVDYVFPHFPGDRIVPNVTLISMVSNDVVALRADDPDGKLRYNMEIEIAAGRQTRLEHYTGRVISSPNILPDSVQQSAGKQTYALVKLDGETSPADLGTPIQYTSRAVEINDVVTVPKKAISKEGGKDYVYILENDVVQKRFVKTAMNTAETVWVLEGLQGGQTVILK